MNAHSSQIITFPPVPRRLYMWVSSGVVMIDYVLWKLERLVFALGMIAFLCSIHRSIPFWIRQFRSEPQAAHRNFFNDIPVLLFIYTWVIAYGIPDRSAEHHDEFNDVMARLITWILVIFGICSFIAATFELPGVLYVTIKRATACIQEHDEDDKCAICLDVIRSSPHIALPCKHCMHDACIAVLDAYEIKPKCPTCRCSL